jgi:PKD repeat protein
MKTISYLPFFIVATFFSCSKQDNTPAPPPTPLPVANFNYTGNTLAPATISFSNQSTNASSYLWDFGDGGNSTSTLNNPTYTYTKGGTYTVKLTATGNGATNFVTKTVNIQSPTAVKILSVKITGLPFLDPSCNCSWDNNSGPDVYFQLANSSGSIILTGNNFDNVTPSMLPLTWTVTPAFQITNFTSGFAIVVWDKDTNDFPSNPDDAIGYTFDFQFSTWANSGYPKTISLSSPNSQLKIEIAVEWL